MRYNLESALPIKAFSPRVKGPFSYGMTLEGGGGGGFNPVSWVGGAVQDLGSVLASIDPGPAIGNIGAQIDSGVRSAVPGGWATLGVAALAIAAPYLAPYLAEAAPALEATDYAAGYSASGSAAGSASATVGAAGGSQAAALTGVGAGAMGPTYAELGYTGLGPGAMGPTYGELGYTGINSLTPSVASQLLSSAGTGSLYGGGMGTVNSLIRGTDPLKGALTGALMGGLTGASLSGIGQTLAQYGINSPALSSAILSASKGLASGANPSTILANTALNTGLSYLGNQASTGLTQAGVDPNVSKILASTGLGAAKAGATGGDPITGAENAALGSTLGLGLGAGKDLLMAPSASGAPAAIHDYSTPIPNGTVSLAGIEGPMSTDVASQYLKNQADQISGDLSKYYPTLSEQQAALADTANKANDIYTQNQADKTALSDAVSKTGYNDARANTTELANTAQKLLDQVNPLQAQYDAAVKKYEDSGRTDRASYDLANSLSPKLNELIPQFNTAYSAFDTANQNLNNLYKTSIEPLYTAFTTSSDSLKTALTDYSNNNAELAKTSNIIANDLQGLDKISQGQLASGWSPGTATMQAPSATADSYYNQLVNAIANPDQPSTTGSQTAANDGSSVTVQGTTDAGGGATTPYVPTQNPETPNYPAGTTVNSDGSATVKNADGSIDNYDANGDLVSTTPAPSDTNVSPIDIIANLPTDNTTPVTPTPVNTSALPVTPTPVDTGSLPVTPTPTPVDTGALPITPTPTPVDTGALPITPTPTPVNTGALPVTPTTNTTDLANLPVAPPATGGGTAPQGGGLPSTTDGSGTVAGGTTDGSGTVAGGGTASTGDGTTAGTTAGTGTGTTAGTGTGTTAGTGTGTTAGTGTGTTAGLTAAGLAAALAGMGGGSSASSGSSTATPATPKGTFVHGKQIASPLGSFNVPTISYATPAPNPNSLEEIENAATGGIMHLASGGSSNEDDLSLKPVLMRGKQAQHANLFGLGGIPLYPIPGKAEGGSISQDFNPQFYSEGGLGSIQNTHVRGPGTGTSDSIPAMLSDGEFVIPADVVASLGNGSNDGGAKMLDSFLKTIRAHKQKHDAKHLPADSKGPLGYLLEAKRKVKK